MWLKGYSNCSSLDQRSFPQTIPWNHLGKFAGHWHFLVGSCIRLCCFEGQEGLIAWTQVALC